MPITTLLFDLDDTLYPPTSGIWERIGHRINQYMVERLQIDPTSVTEIREGLFSQYGTTLRGLRVTRSVDPLDYLKFVHDIPIHELISPNPALRAALLARPLPKWIFTNADRLHAERVLNALGIADCFAGIVDVLDTDPFCKPMPEAYQLALRQVGAPAEECVLFDDSLRNVAGARQAGMAAIHVTPKPAVNGFITLADISQFQPALDRLLNAQPPSSPLERQTQEDQ